MAGSEKFQQLTLAYQHNWTIELSKMLVEMAIATQATVESEAAAAGAATESQSTYVRHNSSVTLASHESCFRDLCVQVLLIQNLDTIEDTMQNPQFPQIVNYGECYEAQEECFQSANAMPSEEPSSMLLESFHGKSYHTRLPH